MLYKGLKVQPVYIRMTLFPPPPGPTPPLQLGMLESIILAFQTPFANTDIYKSSFFPQSIRDWNSHSDSLLSAAEGVEDSVAKLTSLVRARDWPLITGLGEWGYD